MGREILVTKGFICVLHANNQAIYWAFKCSSFSDKNKLKSNQEKLKPNQGQNRGHDNLTFVSDVETGTAISNNRVSPNINTGK